MKNKKVFLGVIILGLLSGYFILLSNLLAAPSVLRGTVIPDSRILSDDGTTYNVITSKKFCRLPNCLGKRVELVGIVEDLDGEAVITMNSFKILSDLPDKRS